MSYVDGFVVPVPKKKLSAYKRMAQKPARSGANTVRRCFTNAPPMTFRSGKRTSFPRSVKLKPSETVVFSFIVYRSRAERDRINAKVMNDPRLAKMMKAKDMPFDAKRMIYGGFKTIVKG